MTLWNPLNVFSGQQRRAGDGTSASFDPFRTGDPLVPGPGLPAVGSGGSQVGGTTGSGDPRRHPIGFAPPGERASEPRYRTEISFKRHHDSPRASATLDHSDSPEPPPLLPDAVVERDELQGAGDEGPAAEDATPFYKREISFRRKRATPEEAAAAVVGTEDDAVEDVAEVVAQADDDEEPARTVDEPTASEVADETDIQDSPAADEGIPFYKREISFRRQRATPEDAAAAAAVVAGEDDSSPDEYEVSAQADHDATPVVAVEEPIAPEVVETHEVDDQTTEPTAGPFADESAPEPAEEDVAELVEDSPPVEAAEPLPVAAAEPLPVAAAEETVTEEETPAEEPSASEGRFSSRKHRSTEKKSLRRKAGQGAKGRKVVGLKIGASQIAASVVSETEAGYELLELARRPLEAGIVVDGEVRDENALAAAVKTLFDEEKLPRNDVRIGLSSNRIGVRTIDIVGSDNPAQFDNAVRFKAHEVLPVALHESALDYRVIDEHPGEGGEHLRRVLLVVAPRDQVEPYQRMADSAGIKLTGIDLEALGLLRAFVEPKSAGAPKGDDTATVVVAIGHESSTLLVAGGGTCEFTRVFDWGGAALEEAIASALEVRPAEAATILRHLSLSGPGRHYEPLDEVTRARATEAVRLRLTPFARELVNSLQFYQTQAESLGIGGIVITGGTSHLEGLSGALHQMIGVDVSVGDPFGRVIRAGSFDPAIEAVIGSMAVPIGLAIDDGSTRAVNLLPKGALERKTGRSTAIAIAIGTPIAAAVPLAALVLLFVGAHGKAADRQAELDAVKAEIAALPAPRVPIIDAGVVGDEAVRATAVASVLGGRLAWDAVFRDMARVLPENVWLTRLSVAQPEAGNLADGAVAAAPLPGQADAMPTAVSVEGFTYSQPDVARLLARLATLPSLQRVTLTSSQTEILGQSEVVRFVIVADLNQTGGVS